MTLVDPKAGVAYAFGEKLPSAHVNTVWAQQPRALDIVAGGVHSCQGTVTVNNGGGGSLVFGSTMDVVWSANNYPKLSSRTLTRVQPLLLLASTTFGSSPDFSFSATTGGLSQGYTDTSGVNDARCWLALPEMIDQATLDTISVVIDPASTGPAEKPKLSLWKFPTSGAAGSQVGSEVTDAFSPYGNVHSIQLTSIGEAIDMTAHYRLRFVGESGSSSVTGLQILAVTAEFTVTKVVP